MIGKIKNYLFRQVDFKNIKSFSYLSLVHMISGNNHKLVKFFFFLLFSVLYHFFFGEPVECSGGDSGSGPSHPGPSGPLSPLSSLSSRGSSWISEAYGAGGDTASSSSAPQPAENLPAPAPEQAVQQPPRPAENLPPVPEQGPPAWLEREQRALEGRIHSIAVDPLFSESFKTCLVRQERISFEMLKIMRDLGEPEMDPRDISKAVDVHFTDLVIYRDGKYRNARLGYILQDLIAYRGLSKFYPKLLDTIRNYGS